MNEPRLGRQRHVVVPALGGSEHLPQPGDHLDADRGPRTRNFANFPKAKRGTPRFGGGWHKLAAVGRNRASPKKACRCKWNPGLKPAAHILGAYF